MKKIFSLLGLLCWHIARAQGDYLPDPKWQSRQRWLDRRAGVSRDAFSGRPFVPEPARPGLHISERDRWRLGLPAAEE